MRIAKGEVRKLLIVIGKLQDAIGEAQGQFANDRDRYSYEKGQQILKKAFSLCLDATGKYYPVEENENA